MTTYTTPDLVLDGPDYVDSRNAYLWLCAGRFRAIALPSMDRLPQKMRLHITPDPNGLWVFRDFRVSLGRRYSSIYFDAFDWLKDRNITRFSAEMEIIEP